MKINQLRKYVLFFLLPFFVLSCAGAKKGKLSQKTAHKSSKSSSKTKAVASKEAQSAVKAAFKFKGTKYKYGGVSKKGIDCSGLMSVSYQEAGVSIPRTSSAQSQYGKRVYIGELLPGDLVFFGAKPKSKKITHVGMVSRVTKDRIYFIHASSSRGVVEDLLSQTYYRPRYISARRMK
jgi:cell wall-associated NlpC family hydrolase